MHPFDEPPLSESSLKNLPGGRGRARARIFFALLLLLFLIAAFSWFIATHSDRENKEVRLLGLLPSTPVESGASQG